MRQILQRLLKAVMLFLMIGVIPGNPVFSHSNETGLLFFLFCQDMSITIQGHFMPEKFRSDIVNIRD